EIIEGKAEEMPFEDKYFDLIVSNNGINNVENDEKALLEIARVSKVGAQMVVTVNLPDTMIELYEVYENILKKNNKNKEIKKLKEHIFSKRKPLSYTKELIKKVGFKIESVFEDSFNLRFSNGSTMLNHFLIKLAFIDSWKAILEEQDVTPIFNTIEKELNKIVQKRGELILTIPWVCIDCRRFEL
ncbi:MAG: class I SAM-dependent methyltransferase, partial [Candidatus Aminicenantia bacterium]